MLRRLAIAGGLLLLVGVLADRGLAAVAGDGAAAAIQRSERLRERPAVRFRGFPFLTQAIGGEFREVEITVRELTRDGLKFDRVDVVLREVRLSLGHAMSGEVEAVPVGSGSARLLLGYDDLTRFLQGRPGRLQVTARGDRAVVSGTVVLPGQGSVDLEGDGVASLRGQRLLVAVAHPRRVDGRPLSRVGSALATSRLTFAIDVANLPFGITVTTVATGPDGLVVGASARSIVVRAR